ncbi:MAG: ATP-binding protein [Pseudomonadota bacterium]
MDLQRASDNVKSEFAVDANSVARRERRILMIAVCIAIFIAALVGLVPWPAAALLAGTAALFGFVRGLSAPIAEVAQTFDASDPEEVRRLRRFSSVLNALPQPVMLLDAEDKVEFSNAAAERIFGGAGEGAHISSMVRAPSALDVLREARHEQAAREGEFSLSAAETFTALFYAAPLAEADGEPGGAMIVMIRDRTEQKKLERIRTDFVANVSHELRTPLASILGFIETLQGHAKEDEEARQRFLGIMQAQTERMLRLVKDLVSLSSLELNERLLPEEQVDLCEVAATVREMLAPVARSAGGEIVEGPADCNAFITGDRDQLVQVIQNLSDNALRYGRENEDQKAVVHVSVGFGDGQAFEGSLKSGDSPEQIAVRAGCQTADLRYVRVRDEGPGIERTDLPRLTERFYRIDVEKSRSQGGTGLGLAIVKHIVGRHRGGILIESQPGEGAAFTCYFPPAIGPTLDKPSVGS